MPPGLDIRPGDYVTVPLNHRSMIGVAWDALEAPEASPVAEHRLKPVADRLAAPPMTASLRRFVDWVAAYTLSPPGAVLRMAMGSAAALEPPAQQAGWMLAPPGGNAQPRLTPERLRVLAAMQPGQAYAGGPLAEAAKVS
ncbi:MAG: primosomal protein N', partial [Acetobacteraceae bacterium]